MESKGSTQPLQQSRPPTTVILFGGLPASGKSTLARRLVKEYEGRVNHLEYDALEDSIVAQQTEEERREAWNEARQVAIQQLEDHFTNNDEATADDDVARRLILMDDNFHLRGMRKQIHRILLNHKPVNFGIIWMQTPMQTCLERNRQRERQIPVHVFEKMSQAMEPPRIAWENSWIEVGEDASFGNVLSFVEACPEIVDLPEVNEEQQEADRQVTAQSQSHNWDKLVRGWVGKVAEYDKTLARAANDARKGVLKLAKEQETCTEKELVIIFVDLVVAGDDGRSRSDLMEVLTNSGSASK
jgi:tRNA uridine 5-carbamoylmethylation protein Kti12